jgi:hypothetical protein
MPTISFKAHGKTVRFQTKSRKTRAAPAKAKARSGKRKGTWPKGKVPKHLKKYLFR